MNIVQTADSPIRMYITSDINPSPNIVIIKLKFAIPTSPKFKPPIINKILAIFIKVFPISFPPFDNFNKTFFY